MSMSCRSSKKKWAVSIVASVVGAIILVAALATFFYMSKRRKQKGDQTLVLFRFLNRIGLIASATGESETNYECMSLEPKGRNITYSVVINITRNFERVLARVDLEWFTTATWMILKWL